jgi:nucleoside-diphosphate-sugar epimerase
LFIHAAGLAHKENDSYEIQERMHKVNVLGTKQIVEFCEKVHIPRFVYISSTSVYDFRSKSADLEVNPKTFYGKSKLGAENIVLNSSLSTYIIRLATLFGEGDKYNFYKLSKIISSGYFLIPGTKKIKKSVFPVKLASRLILLLPFSSCRSSDIVNFALPDSPDFGSICNCLASLHQIKSPKVCPYFISLVLSWFCDLISIFLKFPYNSKILSKLSTNTEVSTTKLQKLFSDENFHDFRFYISNYKNHYSTNHKNIK